MSSFKPLVATAALDQGAEPDDLILDAPTTFNSAGVPYAPRNFDRKFEGNITLRHAMAESRNIPAVKVLRVEGLNVYDLVRYEHLILTEGALKLLEERLAA